MSIRKSHQHPSVCQVCRIQQIRSTSPRQSVLTTNYRNMKGDETWKSTGYLGSRMLCLGDSEREHFMPRNGTQEGDDGHEEATASLHANRRGGSPQGRAITANRPRSKVSVTAVPKPCNAFPLPHFPHRPSAFSADALALW